MVLNVGLNRLQPKDVFDALEAAGIIWCEMYTLGYSDSEETMVLIVSNRDVRKIPQLAETLGEECIAVYEPGIGGTMLGPKCHEWGAFDPAKFIDIDGKRLA